MVKMSDPDTTGKLSEPYSLVSTYAFFNRVSSQKLTAVNIFNHGLRLGAGHRLGIRLRLQGRTLIPVAAGIERLLE